VLFSRRNRVLHGFDQHGRGRRESSRLSSLRRRRAAEASAHLQSARWLAELRAIGVGRVDLGVHDKQHSRTRFYERLGFVSNHETGMALVL